MHGQMSKNSLRLCLWPRRILWVVWWVSTGEGAGAARSRGEVSSCSPEPRWPTATRGPHPQPCRCASSPGFHLAPCSSAQPPWRFSSGGTRRSIHPGGREHLSPPVEPWPLADLPLSPSAFGLGLQEPDRASAATRHSGDSCCCSCYCSWLPFASSTETWGLN